MSGKLKILFVTPTVPYPPDRGDRLRIYNIIKTFVKKHKLKIIFFVKGENEIKYAHEFKKQGFDIELIKLSRLRSYLNLFMAFLTNSPLQVLFYKHKKMFKRVRELTLSEHYDIVYFHIFTMAQYYKAVNTKALKVLDITDAYSLFLERLMNFDMSIMDKIFFRIEKKKVKKYERIFTKFDSVFVCSNIDKEYLEQNYSHKNIKVFENGIDTNIYKYEEEKPEKYRIIFTGNIPYFPNRDAIKYFIKDIFPLILERVPQAKLIIVGKDPTEDILKLANENIIIKGFVKDLKREYLMSEVNVAPIRFGAGTSNKIIEAIALGVPTVATSLALKGFNEGIKKYVFHAETPEEFCERIIEIFNNESIRSKFMKEASDYVLNTLSLDIIVGKMESFLKNKINNKDD